MKMNGNNLEFDSKNENESFKLLQLSDDLKSLSDLELPEVLNQRKRKIRRKTRPRSSSTHRYESESHGKSDVHCKNFGLWLAILMTCMWLFIVSYITSVIHTENRRLAIEIQKVSATSQNVPEALQKWHETSKNLEQNQTILNGKLKDIQQVLNNFSTELKQLKETIDKKNENSQESQLNDFKTTVATLGSKIEDIIVRVLKLEDHYNTVQSDQKTTKKVVDDLQTLFNQVKNNSSPSSTSLNNITEQNIENIKTMLSAQIENLSLNVSTEIQQLQAKNQWQASDLSNHKKTLDDLSENQANISSHVTSIENIWTQFRNNLSLIETSTKQMNDEIALLQNSTNLLKNSVSTVQTECQTYHNQNDQLFKDIDAIKSRIQNNNNMGVVESKKDEEAGQDDGNKTLKTAPSVPTQSSEIKPKSGSDNTQLPTANINSTVIPTNQTLPIAKSSASLPAAAPNTNSNAPQSSSTSTSSSSENNLASIFDNM